MFQTIIQVLGFALVIEGLVIALYPAKGLGIVARILRILPLGLRRWMGLAEVVAGLLMIFFAPA